MRLERKKSRPKRRADWMRNDRWKKLDSLSLLTLFPRNLMQLICIPKNKFHLIKCSIQMEVRYSSFQLSTTSHRVNDPVSAVEPSGRSIHLINNVLEVSGFKKSLLNLITWQCHRYVQVVIMIN